MLKAVSLFSGAGGLDIGLEKAGFATKACVEIEPTMCETLRLNRPKWPVLCNDIRQIPTTEILAAAGVGKGELDLVAGGPPCQAFSKSAYWVPGRLDSIMNDPRALLLKEFVRVVREARPKAFLMENVFGLAYSHGRPALDATVSMLERSGYKIHWTVVNAADFGVPQRRQRVVVIGVLHEEAPNVSAMGGSPHVTVSQALVGLRTRAEPGEKVNGKYGHLLPAIPPGGNYLHYTRKLGHPKPLFEWRSKYWSFLLKLDPNAPSWTIQASPGPYIGPFHWDNRRLRIPEVKRLQTFPDSWQLAGERVEQWRQLGNAVPSLMAQRIGEGLRRQVFEGKELVPQIAMARRRPARRR